MRPDPLPRIPGLPRIAGGLRLPSRLRIPGSSRTPGPGLLFGLFLLFGGGAGCTVEEATPLPGSAFDATPEAGASREDAPSLLVLVRHAEKTEAPAQDPPLSAEGEARARALADLLADAGITRIHSTDTRRTLDTARPLARALGVEIEVYNARELEAFASHLVTLSGRHLVVGHSNTTDRLSGHLGGETFGEIVEAWEYDRLYLLMPALPPAGGVQEAADPWETVLLRFGERALPAGG